MRRPFRFIAYSALSCFLLLVIAGLVVLFGRMDETVEGSGTVFPASCVNVAPEVTGIIETVTVREGDEVEAGDALFRLAADDLRFELEKSRQLLAGAQARLTELQEEYRNLTTSESFETSVILADLFSAKRRMEIALRTYERAEELYAEDLISLEEKERTKLDYEVSESNYEALNERRKTLVRQRERQIEDGRRSVEMARHVYELAEQKLGKTVVLAPICGTVLTPHTRELVGTKATEGQPVIQIGDLSEMTFIAEMRESDIPKVRIGQDVKIYVTAYPHRRYKVFTGTVIEIASAPKVTRSGVTFETKVQIDEPWVEMSASRLSLRPGLSGRAKVVVRPHVRLIDLLFKSFLK